MNSVCTQVLLNSQNQVYAFTCIDLSMSWHCWFENGKCKLALVFEWVSTIISHSFIWCVHGTIDRSIDVLHSNWVSVTITIYRMHANDRIVSDHHRQRQNETNHTHVNHLKKKRKSCNNWKYIEHCARDARIKMENVKAIIFDCLPAC